MANQPSTVQTLKHILKMAACCAGPILGLARAASSFDNWGVDRLVDWLGGLPAIVGGWFRRWQTGLVQHYAAIMFMGVTLMAALCLIAFGDGPVFATTPSLAMRSTIRRTGPAAAMLLAIEVGIGSLAALAVTVFHDGTSRPLAWTSVVLCALIIGALLLRKKKGTDPDAGSVPRVSIAG